MTDITYEQRVELIDAMDQAMKSGESVENAMVTLRYIKPDITNDDIRSLVDEPRENNEVMALHYQEKASLHQLQMAFLSQCPGWKDGTMRFNEALQWIAANGNDEDKETARATLERMNSNQERSALTDKAIDWSPWTEWCDDEQHAWRFLKDHPYGDDEQNYVRLTMDYCAHSLHADMEEDGKAAKSGRKGTGFMLTEDLRWTTFWELWPQTVPPHIRLRIKNAPTEEEAGKWRDYAFSASWFPNKEILEPFMLRAAAEDILREQDSDK